MTKPKTHAERNGGTLSLRRTKQQVAPELPEIMRQVHYSEMEEEQAKCLKKKNQP